MDYRCKIWIKRLNVLLLRPKTKHMNTNIIRTIQSRLDLMGMSQAQFAERVSATPAQMSIFLNGKGNLSMESLNKSLELVGVNLSLYVRRIQLAKSVASYLISKNVTSIENWTKKDLATFTQKEDILLFLDVQSDEEYKKIEQSGIIDIETTFPYFKGLVTYYMELRSKYAKDESKPPTASQAKRALDSIMKEHNSPEKHTISKRARNGAIKQEANLAEEHSPSEHVRDAVLKGAAIGTLAAASPIGGAIGAVAAAAVALSKQQMGASSLFSKDDKQSLFAKALNLIK